MGASIVLSAEELRAQRVALLDQVSADYDELKVRAESYALRPAERAVWESIETIDYLLGDVDDEP